MNANDIKTTIKKWCLNSWNNIFIPEFTYGNKRIDAAIIDINHRWIRGFEIKISRADFLQDDKWTGYSSFCSSLSIACPEGLIKPEEIKKPFGLVWILENKDTKPKYWDKSCIWKKRPKNFQSRNSLAWLYKYVSVIETELPRLQKGL